MGKLIGFSNGYERANKHGVQDMIFSKYAGRSFKSVLLFPSTTMGDLRLGFENGNFTEETVFLFVEKGDCFPYSHKPTGEKESLEKVKFDSKDARNIRKIFFLNELLEYEKEEKRFDVKRCYFHFDELYELDLDFLAERMGISGFDFCYFDFCGGLPERLMEWFRYYSGYFKDSELAFTHCIENFARGNSKTWGKYGPVKPLEFYGMAGDDRDILGDNYENRYKNLTEVKVPNDTHILNTNNLLLFYEMVFGKKYSDVVFYKDMEGPEWNHRQRMCSFRLVNGDYEKDIEGLTFINGVDKPESMLDKTLKYHGNNVSGLSVLGTREFMEKYTYITDEQYSRFMDVIKAYQAIYPPELFRPVVMPVVGEEKISHEKKDDFNKKTNKSFLLKIDEDVINGFSLQGVLRNISKIKDPKKREELRALYLAVSAHMGSVLKSINEELERQEQQSVAPEVEELFSQMSKEEKVRFLFEKMSDKEKLEFIGKHIN